jgi:hydrogenase/urease accessory protein HupE
VLVLRFLLFFGLISVAVSLGVYFLTRDRRYLRFSWQLFKFVGMLLLVVGVVILMGRVILF